MKAIIFDMDGTIADLYSVKDWLPKLRAEDPSPYLDAKPLVRLSLLARKLNKLQRTGYKIGVVSWGSKVSSPEYLDAVRAAKEKWLAQHLRSVKFDSIVVCPYGTPKSSVCPFYSDSAILFDDEENNRNEWGENAFSEKEIFEILGLL